MDKHRCKTGLLLWTNIDEALIEYRRRENLTGSTNRAGVANAIEAYYRHKNGGAAGEACKECGWRKAAAF